MLTSNRDDAAVLRRVVAGTNAVPYLVSMLRYGPNAAFRPAAQVLAHLARVKEHRCAPPLALENARNRNVILATLAPLQAAVKTLVLEMRARSHA